MAVDRCVCLDVSFRRIVAIRDEQGATFDEVQRATGCSTGCRLCEPYVRLALATGNTRFDVLSDDEVRRAMTLDTPDAVRSGGVSPPAPPNEP